MNYESPSKSRRFGAFAQIQESLPGFSMLDDAIFAMASSGVEERGAVYTRREVAEFILDLVGYTPDRALADFRLLEPSFGGGDFLLPAIARLLDSFERSGGRAGDAMSLADALRGVELHADAHATGSRAVVDILVGRGVKGTVAERLAGAWLRQGDFLLAGGLGTFTHVVGNPPYVRQESIPAVLIAEYRRRFTTIYDRADLYVPFFERGLRLLREDGKLGYICSDRWMKNRYGGPLRELVADGFHLQSYVDMYDTPAFLSDVVAYPAITVIGQGAGDETRVAKRPSVDRETLRPLAAELSGDAAPGPAVRVCAGIVRGSEPWIFDATSTLDLVRRLEASLPELEAAGCRVGIGVATGADAAFTGPFDALDVEDDRKLRMATTRDIRDGTVRWRGTGVINPFDASGKLVALADHPRLRAYLEARRDAIAGRHVAKKSPDRWYRTIDRIDPTLAARPKLLVPDIKGSAHIVYENEGLYPHHNLYYVVSDEWDLHALRAVLVSGIARLFVATYSTRMRGGYLRFQAQYLRRIRVPYWRDVPPEIRKALVEASIADDRAGCDAATVALYGLSEAEQKLMSEQA